MNDPRPRLCVFGSLNMDLTVRAPRLPQAGETLAGSSFATTPGGKGANQAVAGARLGAQVAMIGAVGRDAYGEAFRAALAAEGIDASAVRADDAHATGVGVVTVSDGSEDGTPGENSIVVALGANLSVSGADAERAAATIGGADVLLAQLECPVAAVARAAEIARQRGVTVVLNAAPAAALGPDLLACVDVLVVNRVEAQTIARGRSLDRLGVPTVIVTRGAEGATLIRGMRERHVAAFAVRTIDSVGAGDAFVGALATRWAEHQAAGMLDEAGIADAMCWACAAGALATTRAGAMPAMPRRAEVVGLLRGLDALDRAAGGG